MACMRRSFTVSLVALVCVGGVSRAEDNRRPAGHVTSKGGVTPDNASRPPAPPTTPGAAKAGQPKRYNPKEVGVDKSVPWQ